MMMVSAGRRVGGFVRLGHAMEITRKMLVKGRVGVSSYKNYMEDRYIARGMGRESFGDQRVGRRGYQRA